MATDISPALLEKLQDAFAVKLQKIELTRKDYDGAFTYAERVGAALAETFAENLSSADLPDGKMYYNIANAVVRPLLKQDYTLIDAATRTAQQTLNKAAGIGIKAQSAPFNDDKADGIVNKLADAERYDDAAGELCENIKTFSRGVVDDALEANIEFQGAAGLYPKVIRIAEAGCCPWCSKLAGTYAYPDVPKDVYRRHANCRCRTTYDPGDGGKTKVIHEKGDAAQRRAQEKAAAARIEKAEALQLAQERDKLIVAGRSNATVVQAVRKGEVSLAVKESAQKRHLINSDGYISGRSYMSGTIEDAQVLINQYAGTGEAITTKKGWTHKERVTTDHVFGVYVNSKTGEEIPTKNGLIIYSKTGTHIVPARE